MGKRRTAALFVMVTAIFLLSALTVSAEDEMFNNSSEKGGFNYVPPIEELSKQGVDKDQPTVGDVENGWIPDNDDWGVSENPVVKGKTEEKAEKTGKFSTEEKTVNNTEKAIVEETVVDFTTTEKKPEEAAKEEDPVEKDVKNLPVNNAPVPQENIFNYYVKLEDKELHIEEDEEEYVPKHAYIPKH